VVTGITMHVYIYIGTFYNIGLIGTVDLSHSRPI